MVQRTNFVPTPTTLPATITAPPTIQFTPRPECYDATNNWIVTIGCYAGAGFSGPLYPDWLTCSVSQFGIPDLVDFRCNVPYRTDLSSGAPRITGASGVLSYYAGCPAGLTAATTTSYPGWDTWSYLGKFDATGYKVACCPTQYHFELPTGPYDFRRLYNSSTVHDGQTYYLKLSDLPQCAATSIMELSGKEIPVRTWLPPSFGEGDQPPKTTLWDYENGTMFANSAAYTYTVFQGTHTCYEDCSKWFIYYNPNGRPASKTSSAGGILASLPTSTALFAALMLSAAIALFS
ncbi:hypothetical protein HD806DRAFT_477883 [Xylariaceae sp. AK1471]|nr:hypothetical protein HD806DRAFT_477883 [Xylariaceae sp. AK1471]